MGETLRTGALSDLLTDIGKQLRLSVASYIVDLARDASEMNVDKPPRAFLSSSLFISAIKNLRQISSAVCSAPNLLLLQPPLAPSSLQNLSLSLMSSSSPSCSLNPTTVSLHPKPHHHHASSLTFPVSKPSSLCLFPKAHRHLRVLSASPGSPDYGLEESRWLREEQRWLREEQRWLREEQRWARERESLLGEIAGLKLRVQALEREVQIPGGDPGEVANMAALLRALQERNLIAGSGSSASPLVLEEKKEEEAVEEKAVGVSQGEAKEEESESEERKKMRRRALRVGAEGDEVRAMQEALQRLGFYSGEDDLEYSTFSSGTERAVKTWQASVGAKEDGVMTVELLERLYFGKEDGANGAAALSVTEMSEIQQTLVKQTDSEVEVSQHRVFLLGENRWEEPKRLAGRNRQDSESKSGNKTTKCLACRGEGRVMCTECDGTGEPNIEPQFMEWIDEGATCPYCEGLGHTICDVCEGKTVV
ncbi:protein disulfide isomerase pTAC5, chloroplastic [Rhodamnia argentea]|uniref:Protein disulfide isomerase pTAC5, chloroplastic n=1 Tax=Rhodamnia argentea TaxID=178133 RepID=A0A8B8PHW8_9MYRT|nr:protein disulfide isomerase pTAC5, chloroplastic [Rhodamnia argentea]